MVFFGLIVISVDVIYSLKFCGLSDELKYKIVFGWAGGIDLQQTLFQVARFHEYTNFLRHACIPLILSL